jgi:hypothetical protein
VTFNQIVWGVCIALEIFLLFRAARTNLFQKFPLFYSYIASVLAKDILSIPVYTYAPSWYGSFYWSMAVLLAAISYGVLMETYHQSLKNYSGVAKFFRIFLFIMFLVIAAKVAVGSFSDLHSPFGRVVAELERDLRQLQAVLLCCLLLLLLYYKIAVGKNLRGLIFGYSLLIGTEVITRTFAFNPATGFDAVMRKIEPALYAVSLLIWTVTLWASSPEVVADRSCGIEQDYGHLARETRMMLVRARAHLARAARP